MSDMKWYVVHTYSGMEKSAESALRERIAREGLQDYFEEILVPTEDISEVKNGKKRVSTRRMYSGYIFVKMIMNDETWHLVKNTARITGFLGGSANKPSPLPAKDIEAIKSKMEAGSEAPRPRVEFEVGGSVVMPAGTGKTVRVAVFAQGAAAEAAKEAGADIVGMEDLAHEIKGGKMDFDVVIAEPAAMRVVGQLGQILGPRGLMPNPKVGTVTPNVAQAVKNAKAGQVQFRADKAGIIHAPVGRASFEVEQLLTNIKALIEQLNKIKPASTKGVYIRKVAVSSTMGPGVKVDVQTLN